MTVFYNPIRYDFGIYLWYFSCKNSLDFQFFREKSKVFFQPQACAQIPSKRYSDGMLLFDLDPAENFNQLICISFSAFFWKNKKINFALEVVRNLSQWKSVNVNNTFANSCNLKNQFLYLVLLLNVSKWTNKKLLTFRTRKTLFSSEIKEHHIFKLIIISGESTQYATQIFQFDKKKFLLEFVKMKVCKIPGNFFSIFYLPILWFTSHLGTKNINWYENFKKRLVSIFHSKVEFKYLNHNEILLGRCFLGSLLCNGKIYLLSLKYNF